MGSAGGVGEQISGGDFPYTMDGVGFCGSKMGGGQEFESPKGLKGLIPIHLSNSFVCRGVKMNGRKKILIALFSTLVLLLAVTLAGCGGDEMYGGW